MNEDKQFLTKARFAKLIEDTVLSHKSSYIDAIIHVCETYDVEIEEIRKFISPVIKDKVEAEAMKLNFLPRSNALPLD
jgi:UDP-glucose 6-dehydrogenase